MLESVRVCVPRHLQIGKGSLSHLPEILSTMGTAQRPLIVTDRMMVDIGHVAQVTRTLEEHSIHYHVFDEVTPDPTDTVIHSGINALRSGDCDSVIGLGGGSPIDTAKAIAVLSQHGENILDYRPPHQSNEPGLPIIAIPTTAGTGSEVTHHAVIVHTRTQEKISCRGEAFVPSAAIVDFELTLSKPARITADTALDTLTHAIEAYVSARASLFTDRMALDCMRLVACYIERAYHDGSDAEAREGLMLAATLGGLAFSNASICLIHAMSRPLGSLFKIPHGLSNAMLLPQVSAYSLEGAAERYAQCARTMSLASAQDCTATACTKLIDGLYQFQRELQIPSIARYGVPRSQFDDSLHRMADDAMRSGAPNHNPRVPTRDDIVSLYQQAW